MKTVIKRDSLAWLVLCVLGAISLALPARAASFDCAKAQIKVEILICSDAELSRLDDDLAAAYATSLQDKKQANEIRQAQRQWVRERKGCVDADCLKRVYQDRLLILLRVPPSVSDSISKKNLHTSDIPRGEASAVVQQPVCPALAGLWANGSFKRYAIPLEQATSDELIYKVDIDNDGRVDEIRALCGNGADASCELTVSFDGIEPIEFALAANIRLLKFRKSVYIVGGVLISHNGEASFSNYTAHKISRRGIELTCKDKP